MEILIKKIQNGSILYLKNLDGNNIEAEIVSSYDEEKLIVKNWLLNYDIQDYTDERITDKYYDYYNINHDSTLIIVFYMQKQLLEDAESVTRFGDSVNSLLQERDINGVAFFVPTDGDNSVKCINPAILPEGEVQKVNLILEDLTAAFNLE